MRLDRAQRHPAAVAAGLRQDGVVLVLSERNVRTLLSKLERPESHKTILAPAVQVQDGEVHVGRPFAVLIEEDGEHYNHPDRVGIPAGPMFEDNL